MYNGIGLTTPRGSGTNGYVQRNWATVRKTKDSVNYRTEEEIAKLDSASNKQPNQEILDHERKRKIEVKCAELEDSLEDQGLPKEEIAARVAAFRAKLAEAGSGDKAVPRDEFGRVTVRETHAVAEAQQEKNARLRDAFGISPRFVEGTSLDPERRARDHAQRYPLVRTPSRERDERQPHAARKKKKRSTSPEAKKLKKKKSKKNKKDKQESSKKKKKRSKSQESESSSSSEAAQESDSGSSAEERPKKKKKKKSSGRRRGSSEPSTRESSPVKHSKDKPRERSVEARENDIPFRKKDRDREDKTNKYDRRDDISIRNSRQYEVTSRRRDERSESREERDPSPGHRRKSHITKIENRVREPSRDDSDRAKATKRSKRDQRSSESELEETLPMRGEKRNKPYRRDNSPSPPPEKRRRKSPSLEYRKKEETYYNRKELPKESYRSRKASTPREDRRIQRRSESPDYRKRRDESYNRKEREDKTDKRSKNNHERYEEELPRRRDRDSYDELRRRNHRSPSRDRRDTSPECREKSQGNKPYKNKEARREPERSNKNSRQERKTSMSESESEPSPKKVTEKESKNKTRYYRDRSITTPKKELRQCSSSPEYRRKVSPPPKAKPEKIKSQAKIVETKVDNSRARRKSPSPDDRQRRRQSSSKSQSPSPARKTARKEKRKSVTPKNKKADRRTISPKENRDRHAKEKNRDRKESHKDRSRSRSNRKSRSTSSLSYSPARRSPERYRDIIEKLPDKDKRKYIKSPSDLHPKKKKKEIENYKPKAVCMRSSSSENDESEEDFLKLDERARQDELDIKELNRLKEKLTQMAKVSMEKKRLEESNAANGPSTSQAGRSDPKPKEDDKAKKANESPVVQLQKEKSKSPVVEVKKAEEKPQSAKERSPVHVESSPEVKERERSGSRRTWSRSSSRRSRSRSRGKSSRSRSRVKSSRSRSRVKSSRSRSRSRSRSSRSRSRSYSSSRRSRSSRSSSYSSRSSSRSSRSSSRSTRSSRTMTGVYADYRRSSEPRARTRSRSPSIPRRAGSPSFLDRRRITSARKRPIPYRRPTPSTPTSGSGYSSRSSQKSWSRSPRPERD